MKTPDEIKKALECCFYNSAQCGDCPYYPVSCDKELVRDAREYIRQLESGIAEWEDVAASPGAVEDMAREIDRLEMQKRQTAKRIQQLEAERDAAVADLKELANKQGVCFGCKWFTGEHCGDPECKVICSFHADKWQWRGVQKEE